MNLSILVWYKLLHHLICWKIANRIHRLQLFRWCVFNWFFKALAIFHVAWCATWMNFLAFAHLLNVLSLHIVWMRCSTCRVCCRCWTSSRGMCSHLHKMNILSRLTLTAVASLGWATLFESFVLGTALVGISINVHAFGLNLVHLIVLSCATRFDRWLIDIPWRIVYQTAVVWIGWWLGSSHYLLGLLYLQLHLLYLVHMLYLSFAQIALNLLVLRCLRWRFLKRRAVCGISSCILMRHDVHLELIRFLMLSSYNWNNTLICWWHLILLWATNDYWTTFLYWIASSNYAFLLIQRNVLLILHLISFLCIVATYPVLYSCLLWISLMITLIDNLWTIVLLQMYIIQCFAHMNGSLDTVIRIFLRLFHHYICP